MFCQRDVVRCDAMRPARLVVSGQAGLSARAHGFASKPNSVAATTNRSLHRISNMLHAQTPRLTTSPSPPACVREGRQAAKHLQV